MLTENKNTVLQIRLTGEQKALIFAAAKAKGCQSVSDFIREAALKAGREPKRGVDENLLRELIKTLHDLARFGNLLKIGRNAEFAVMLPEIRKLKDEGRSLIAKIVRGHR